MGCMPLMSLVSSAHARWLWLECCIFSPLSSSIQHEYGAYCTGHTHVPRWNLARSHQHPWTLAQSKMTVHGASPL